MKYAERDLKTAHEILGSPEKEIILEGPHQQMAEQVVKAVAEGIALGRNQDLELAASLIEKELASLAGCIRQISC